MADCLTTAEIEGLLADTLSPADKARVEAHLAACEKCRQEVERGRADDELFGKIKQAYEAETVSRRDEPANSQGPSRPPTESIEGYEILSEVHRGGQGVVYKAVQKATKRTVALKVLLEGPYASPRQRHRFEREIDLVASLQHPNIVTVYDSGVTRDGRHFFAMAYIHGQPLDAYLSDKNLSIDETLRLFQKICAAVNHAHQHGVIHRDLKPGNIRVDASGEPHVLDFGLAKAGAGSLTPDGAPVTVTGEFMGTLAYASPEQTQGDPTLIDIRTDVYSLGVILYEMLTGKYPYQVVGQMADVLRNIAEAEPKRPSTIRRQINDEVETIVLKALSKEKERRYQSADTLGRDIEHYLNGEPLEAKRDSSWYMLKKALRRYKAPATAAAGYLIIVTVALLACLALWGEAMEQRRVADEARLAEAAQRKTAEAERDRAIAAEQLARSAEREARHQAYVSGITAASAALAMNEIRTVQRLLDAAPPSARGWEWRYLDAQADDSLNVLRGHGEPVNSAAFSPNGRVLASGSGWTGIPLDVDYTVRLWDASTGEQLSALKGHTGTVYQVAFSPDGTRLASASRDTSIRLWDANTAEELAVLRGHDDDVTSVAFSPDGTRLASGSFDKTIRLWEASTAEELAVLRGHESPINSVAFSPDGRLVASGSGWGGPDDDYSVRLWDASTGEELAIVEGHKGGVQSVVFSPDGTRLASTSWDSTVRIWDASTGDELVVIWTGAPSVAFSPDGSRLASASWDRTVRLWDPVTGEELATFRGHEDHVYSAVFSPDGEFLVSASKDKTVRIWDALMGERLTLRRGDKRGIGCVAFSPDGKRLASAGQGHSSEDYDDTVRLWDAATGQELAVLRGHDDQIDSVVFSPDGTRLASASGDKTIRLWDITTGEELAVLEGHEDTLLSVAFSPDGTRLASTSRDKTVRLWNAGTGEEVAVLRRDDLGFGSVAFSPDGRHLAVASSGNTVRLWQASSGLELAVMAGHERGVQCVTFSPDCRLVASASSDGTVRLWDTSSGEELAVLKGHESLVESVAFSPDGTRLASASWDRTVRLWNVLTGDEMAILRGCPGFVRSVVFSPDGERLASGSSDRTIRIWDTKPYRVRYQEGQVILAARPEAERIVDGLRQNLSDWNSVAQRLRTDTMLTEPVRRAALNEVLSRAAGPGNTGPPASQPPLEAASKPSTQPAAAQKSSTP